VPKGSKVIIHWHESMKREKGMAYVCLGRCEALEDIYICGNFQASGIACSADALNEANRLLEIFEKGSDQNQQENMFNVSFLNIRSLKKHENDVRIESLLMNADIFCLCETWLNESEYVQFEGFKGIFVNAGRGKGIATYIKSNPTMEPVTINTKHFSSIVIQTHNMVLCFIYASSECNQDEIIKFLSTFALDKKPTAVVGDFNWDCNKSCKIRTFFEKRKFRQVINEPTHEMGNIIDHVYLNSLVPCENVKSYCSPAYFSDHDLITLQFSMK